MRAGDESSAPVLPPSAVRRLRGLLSSLVAGGVAPGLVLAVARGEGRPQVISAGRLDWDPGSEAVDGRTIYDVASLTKAIATTGVTMALIEAGELTLETRLVDLLPDPGLHGGLTVGALLSHTAGLPPWMPFYLDCDSRSSVLAAVRAVPCTESAERRTVYSDLGMMLLGEGIEARMTRTLDDVTRTLVTGPLKMTDACFRPDPGLLVRIAPTEDDPWRGGVVHGEVHDENAYAMGGVAGHAGMFATAPEVARFGWSLIDTANDGDRFVGREVVALMLTEPAVPDAQWVHGFRRLGHDPLFGSRTSPSAFGLTGFTGTFLLVDPRQRVSLALLSNSVHPSRENSGIIAARGLVTDAVLSEVGT